MPRRTASLHLTIASPAQTALNLADISTSWLTLPQKRANPGGAGRRPKAEFFLPAETEVWDDAGYVWVKCEGAPLSPPDISPPPAYDAAEPDNTNEDEAVQQLHHLPPSPRRVPPHPAYPRLDPAEHRKRALRLTLRRKTKGRSPTDVSFARPALPVGKAARTVTGSLLGAMQAKQEEAKMRQEEEWYVRWLATEYLRRAERRGRW